MPHINDLFRVIWSIFANLGLNRNINVFFVIFIYINITNLVLYFLPVLFFAENCAQLVVELFAVMDVVVAGS